METVGARVGSDATSTEGRGQCAFLCTRPTEETLPHHVARFDRPHCNP